MVHPPAPAGEVVGKDSKAYDQSSSGGKGDGSDDGDSDDGEVDDVERQEERAKAGEAFDEVDNTGRGWVGESQFEAFMEAVGTTYSMEDHKPKLLSVCREKRLEREVFLTWYDDWLFGEDDSSDGEGEEGKEVGTVSKTEGFASLLASQADGWKCKACLVSNPESAVKYLSCETAKSGKDSTVADRATHSSKSSPGSAFGLSFGLSKGTGNFTFGSPPAPASATISSHVSSVSSAFGGFTFGSSPAGAPVSVVPTTKPTAEDFRFGAPIATSASVAPASATTAPVVYPPAPAGEVVDKDSKVDGQSSSGGEGDVSDDGDSDDGEDDDVERQEERSRAGEAFDEVDSTGRGWVKESQFEALMEAVGTTYSVEDHKSKLLSVCGETRLEREFFLTWYDDWLFGEDDSSDGGGEEGKEVGAVSKTEGFASLLASQADRWKCNACLVSNPESAVKCHSCETVKPGERHKVVESSSISNSSEVSRLRASSFAGGFTFGATRRSALESHAPPSCLGSGTTTSGVFPFGFVVPQAEAMASSPVEASGSDHVAAKAPSSSELGLPVVPLAVNIGAAVDSVEENAKGNDRDTSLPMLDLSQQADTVFAIRSSSADSGGRFSFGLTTGSESSRRAAASRKYGDGGNAGDVSKEAESLAVAGGVPLNASMSPPPRIVATAAANSDGTSPWTEGKR